MKLAPEKWKRVPGWLYEISSSGRVRSVRSGRVLKPSLGNHGYQRIIMTDQRLGLGKSPKMMLIHRLVLLVFRGPCPSGYESSHKNDIKTDNRLRNLAWETHSKNLRRWKPNRLRRAQFAAQEAA